MSLRANPRPLPSRTRARHRARQEVHRARLCGLPKAGVTLSLWEPAQPRSHPPFHSVSSTGLQETPALLKTGPQVCLPWAVWALASACSSGGVSQPPAHCPEPCLPTKHQEAGLSCAIPQPAPQQGRSAPTEYPHSRTQGLLGSNLPGPTANYLLQLPRSQPVPSLGQTPPSSPSSLVDTDRSLFPLSPPGYKTQICKIHTNS